MDASPPRGALRARAVVSRSTNTESSPWYPRSVVVAPSVEVRPRAVARLSRFVVRPEEYSFGVLETAWCAERGATSSLAGRLARVDSAPTSAGSRAGSRAGGEIGGVV